MERHPNMGDATGDIYGFAFGEAAYARLGLPLGQAKP